MANPETCLHNIRAVGINDDGKAYIYCASCDTEFDSMETVRPGKFEYDIDYNVWVFVPEKK